jgi:hypothetical protein
MNIPISKELKQKLNADQCRWQAKVALNEQCLGEPTEVALQVTNLTYLSSLLRCLLCSRCCSSFFSFLLVSKGWFFYMNRVSRSP